VTILGGQTPTAAFADAQTSFFSNDLRAIDQAIHKKFSQSHRKRFFEHAFRHAVNRVGSAN
jgi:hypothetical protein